MTASEETAAAAGEGAVVVRRAGVVAVFTLASRILGYVRDGVCANVFGASGIYDAFVIAQTIPNLLRRLVAEGSLVIAFVPLLAAERERGGLAAMQRFTSAVLGVLIPVLLLLSALGVIFPEIGVLGFASGFDEGRFEIAAKLTQIMMPYIAFVSLTALAGGVLNTQGHFAAPAAAPILLNISIIGFAVVLRGYFDVPIAAVAWGVLIGGVLQLLSQLPFLARRKMLVAPRIDLRHEALRTLGRRMVPVVFGAAVYQLNIVVIRQLGSYLPAGQLSWYYNSTRLQEFALGIFAVSVSIAALPTLAEHAAREDWNALRGTYRRALRITNFITVPSTAALLVLAGPIVGVLFRHGAFTAIDSIRTAELLQILALALVPIGVVRVVVPTFYALGDTRTPVIAASISMVVTLAAGMLLVRRFEMHGLVLATSLAAVAQLAVLWALLRATLKRRAAASGTPLARLGPGDESIAGHAIRCALAVAPIAGAAYFARGIRDWQGGGNIGGALLLAAIGAAAIAGYIAMAKLLRIGEVDPFLAAMKRRILRS